MSMITDKMVGEYKEFYMYKNDSGMYYFSDLVNGYFIRRVFDTIEDMKDFIDSDKLGKI